MPGNIRFASPEFVYEPGPMVAFSEERRYEVLENVYPNGHSTQYYLSNDSRRYFKFIVRLNKASLEAQRNFYNVHRFGKPFWFYNPRETVPLFMPDSSGQLPAGRYACVFDGDWQEVCRYPLYEVSIALREIV